MTVIRRYFANSVRCKSWPLDHRTRTRKRKVRQRPFVVGPLRNFEQVSKLLGQSYHSSVSIVFLYLYNYTSVLRDEFRGEGNPWHGFSLPRCQFLQSLPWEYDLAIISLPIHMMPVDIPRSGVATIEKVW